MPNIRDLSDPEFGPIKARLARAYLEHKGDLGVLLTDDAEIIALVDEITALLLAAWVQASLADNQRWKERYSWFLRPLRSCRTPCRASRSMAEREAVTPMASACLY